MQFPSDPKFWGPGVWWSSHVDAYNIRQDDIPYFIRQLKVKVYNLPCAKCKTHASQYIRDNNPEEFIKNDVNKCFEYTVNLHNHANMMTGKDTISMEEAREIYRHFSNHVPDSYMNDNIIPKSNGNTITILTNKRPIIIDDLNLSDEDNVHNPKGEYYEKAF